MRLSPDRRALNFPFQGLNSCHRDVKSPFCIDVVISRRWSPLSMLSFIKRQSFHETRMEWSNLLLEFQLVHRTSGGYRWWHCWSQRRRSCNIHGSRRLGVHSFINALGCWSVGWRVQIRLSTSSIVACLPFYCQNHKFQQARWGCNVTQTGPRLAAIDKSGNVVSLHQFILPCPATTRMAIVKNNFVLAKQTLII